MSPSILIVDRQVSASCKHEVVQFFVGRSKPPALHEFLNVWLRFSVPWLSLSREQKRQLCLPIFSARDLFNQQRFSPDASRAILVRAFEGSNCMLWLFDQRKLIYFRRLEGHLGMCRQNVRAVFLPKGFARLGWGSVFYLPKAARPTGLRECFLYWGEEGW